MTSNRIQRIRLVRPESGGFGFYIRGGAEHGLGIYISQVEIGSEAHVKGLKKGDQILKVCGLYVDKATHKEIFSLIKEKTSLDLKVRSEGVLPVKQTKSAPVSWKSVKDEGLESSDELDEGIRMDEPLNKVDDPGGGHNKPGYNGNQRHKPGDNGHHQQDRSRAREPTRDGYLKWIRMGKLGLGGGGGKADSNRERSEARGSGGSGSRGGSDIEFTEVKISLELKEQQGLGCSICKGPPEKPGIFIQSTKVGKLAREVGLQTGDQIVHCNGIDFLNIPFGDAVFHLKASKQLNLTIWKGAGSSLFPNESSGYESSSGSSTGTSKPRGKRTIKTSFPVPRAPPPPGTSTSSSPSSSSSGGTSSPSSKSRGVVAASPRHGKRPPSQLSHCPASPVTSHMSSHCPGSPAQAQQLSSMRGPASPVISVQMSRGSPASPASMLSRGQPVHGSQLLYSHGSPISYRSSPASTFERDLERERQRLESEKEKLRREQQALQIERNRLEQEKILFRNTIQRTQSEERPTKTVQSAVREIERSSSVHSTARETLLMESIVNRRRTNGNKSMDLESDTGTECDYSVSEHGSKDSFDSGEGGTTTGDEGGSSSGGGGLASALQSEIRRRAEKNAGVGTATKGILKKSDSNSLVKSPSPAMKEHTNKHDLLIAEFKQAHMRKRQVGEEHKTPTPHTPSPLSLRTETPTPTHCQAETEPSLAKPKAPPPPPPMKTSTLQAHGGSSAASGVYSSITPSVSSETSEANRSLSTFRPDSRMKSDSEESESTEKQSGVESVSGSQMTGSSGHLATSAPIFIPGIPTPDYDATPDRSPSATGKLYIRNRNIGKRVSPPTIEGITRAKSLNSLVTASEDHKNDSEGRTRGKGSSTGGLLSSGSMKDISKTPESSPVHSVNSSLRSYEAPSLNFSYSSQSTFNVTGKEYSETGSMVSGSMSHYSRRQINTEGVSMESFQLDMAKQVDYKPPPTYFDSLKTTPLSITSASSFGGEKESFQFQTKPCHPSQIPVKEEGEEAKLASQDYRAVNAQPRPRPYCLDIKSLQREFQEDKTPKQNKVGARYPGIYKEDNNNKNRGFPKFSGLKKPAPPPPILRKI